MIKLKHKKLKVWQGSIELTTVIYDLTQEFPKYELYGLTSQLRRAARSSSKERRRFYEISRSSIVEIDTQLEIAMRLGYFKEATLENIEEQLNHIFAMLSNLIKSCN